MLDRAAHLHLPLGGAVLRADVAPSLERRQVANRCLHLRLRGAELRAVRCTCIWSVQTRATFFAPSFGRCKSTRCVLHLHLGGAISRVAFCTCVCAVPQRPTALAPSKARAWRQTNARSVSSLRVFIVQETGGASARAVADLPRGAFQQAARSESAMG